MYRGSTAHAPVFDVADGTLSRLHQSSLKMSNISRIFISHMHGDHVLGLVAVLKQIMTGVGMTEDQLEALRKQGDQKKVSGVSLESVAFRPWPD